MQKPKYTDHQWTILYFQRLGEFVHTFSAIEREMQKLLWHFAGVSKRTGKAVFSGVKTHVAIKHLKKLIQNRDTKVRADLTDVFAQLTLINDARNLMLHQQVKRVRKNFIVISSDKTSFSKEGIKEVVVSPSIVKKMTDDLHKIRTHIDSYTEGDTPYFKAFSPRFLSASWQYIPPLKRNRKGRLKKQKHRNKGQKHPILPESSQA